MPEPAASRVLVISYLFPPSGGVGVQRALSYARYLPESGCEVFVLTARNAAPPVSDPELLRMVPARTVVSRAFTPEIPYALRSRVWKRFARQRFDANPSGRRASGRGFWAAMRSLPQKLAERFFSPDAQVVWVPFARRAAMRLVRRHRITAVLVTAPPFSSLRIGVDLKRRFPHLKLISEFRDEWVGYYLAHLDAAANDHRRRQAARQERAVVETSDFVVAVTPAQSRSIHARYPEQPSTKFLTIPNGYDPETFAAFQPRPAPGNSILVTYLGSLYANPVYSPALYLDALDLLPEPIRSRIETRFIGRIEDQARPLLANRRTAISSLGFLPQSAALQRLEETGFLLLLVNSPTAHAGKFFDYLAAFKPILAFTPPEGALAGVIRDTRSGFILDPTLSPRCIAEALAGVFQSTAPFETDRDAIARYQRPRLVAELARAAGLAKL